MRVRIIIDDQDAADAPEEPFTLNVFQDDDGGTMSRFSRGDEAVLGADVPTMLRELADRWEDDRDEYERFPYYDYDAEHDDEGG